MDVNRCSFEGDRQVWLIVRVFCGVVGVCLVFYSSGVHKDGSYKT